MAKSKYMELLNEKYGNKEAVFSELINLEAILTLPKGTELFISDIHGEYESFNHILRTGSGNIKEKVYTLFGNAKSDKYKDFLCLLIAYPEQMLEKQLHSLPTDSISKWYVDILMDLLAVTRHCSSKYSRSKVRKALPVDYAYILEELLYSSITFRNKRAYYKKITDKLIHLNLIKPFIISLSKSIQRFVIDHVHIVGDIFDRGLETDKVMETIANHHSIDIQWGNHDILWMGAYAGNKACLATILRIAAKYNYLYNLEESYGLNLRPLFIFADEWYKGNKQFSILNENNDFCYEKNSLLEKVHQALAIIQFKLEGQIIERRPEFDVNERLLLKKINYQNNTIIINNKQYNLINPCFHTVDETNPLALNKEEEYIINAILHSFQNSEKLQRHIQFLLDKGSMYLVYNNNLLFHGCVPMTDNKEFACLTWSNSKYSGKSLFNYFEEQIRSSVKNIHKYDDFCTDFMWYSWTGKLSPLYGRKNMTTFERYFIKDKSTHEEENNNYYVLREDETICRKILKEFGLSEDSSKIINGHTPVKVCIGEHPVRANGELIIIDGGLSKAYHKTTGIAGYTLLSNSYGLQIVTHSPFKSFEYLYNNFSKDTVVKSVVDKKLKRKFIKDTTVGQHLHQQCQDLYELLKYIT